MLGNEANLLEVSREGEELEERQREEAGTTGRGAPAEKAAAAAPSLDAAMDDPNTLAAAAEAADRELMQARRTKGEERGLVDGVLVSLDLNLQLHVPGRKWQTVMTPVMHHGANALLHAGWCDLGMRRPPVGAPRCCGCRATPTLPPPPWPPCCATKGDAGTLPDAAAVHAVWVSWC